MHPLHDHAEAACLAAWPALSETTDDGWLLRVAAGETRRSNSVNVIGASRQNLADKIARAEQMYRANNLTPCFRTRTTDAPDLESALVARGYVPEGETRTLLMDFATHPPRAVPAIATTLSRQPADIWLAAHAAFESVAARRMPTRAALLARIDAPVAYAAAHVDGAIASIAFAAVHQGMACLQWVASDPRLRRQGLSRATLGALLGWAETEAGATHACLQVLADNTPAIRLYESLGFTTELNRYRYWLAPR